MATFWSKVAVKVQSALGTAQTITGISKANPGVVSHSGTDPSNGDYVLLKVAGMEKLDGRVVRVASAGVGTFELEGIDTTAYDDFSSGTFQVITFGNNVTTWTDVSPSGGDPDFVDITTIHNSQKKQVPVISSGLTLSATSIYDPADTTLQALQTASDNLEERAFQLVFANGSILVLNGYVSLPMIPTGQSQGLVTTPLTVTANGRVTAYAS